MTSLYYNIEHKSKIIDMASKLFKGKSVYTQHQYITVINDQLPGDKIHWFEFTMTMLFNAVTEKTYMSRPFYLGKILQGIEAIQNGGENIDQEHPVDYLYNLFKELKL